MLTNDWLSAFLPICCREPSTELSVIGAGCIVLVDNQFAYVVTAAHVLAEATSKNIILVFTKAGGGVSLLDLSQVQSQNGLKWHLHESADCCAALMPISSEWEIKGIAPSQTLKFAEFVPSMGCYTVGCPYGVTGFDPLRNTPLVLEGIVSGLDTKNKSIFTSAPTFPGNSGGPLIVHRSPFNPAGGLVVGQPVLFLGGIMTRVHYVRHPASPELPGLHLGEACSIEFVLDLLDTKEIRKERLELIKGQ